MYDLNDAQPQMPPMGEPIPDGTFAKIRMTIRPGGVDGAGPMDKGLLKASASSDARMLDCEFTVLEGPYARRKIFTLIGLYSPKGPEWANMGRALIRGILNSARGISDKDTSPEAQAARRISGFKDLDGIEFLARVDVGEDVNGDPKNEIRKAITPDHRDYAKYLAGAMQMAPAASAPAASPAQPKSGIRPSWAE